MARAYPIDPGRMLVAARHLAYDDAGPGRPSPVFLRRAISSAYYALYHHLTLAAAVNLVPYASETERLQFARAFGHQHVKVACGWVNGRQGAGNAKTLAGVDSIARGLRSSDINPVAVTFWNLQEERHEADYNHLKAVSKSEALSQIALAERAIGLLDGASVADRSAFFALMALAVVPQARR